jgi:hypothetical protein
VSGGPSAERFWFFKNFFFSSQAFTTILLEALRDLSCSMSKSFKVAQNLFYTFIDMHHTIVKFSEP